MTTNTASHSSSEACSRRPRTWTLAALTLAGLSLALAEPAAAQASSTATPPSAIPGGLTPKRLQQLRNRFEPTGKAAAEPPTIAQATPPTFQMPFKCNQKWLATTYDGHFPDPDSIDLRRYSGNTNISNGEAVFASAGGTVSEVGTDWYGDWVYIDHDNGWQTRYLHINKLASMVIGKTVVRGQKIGSVGKFSDIEPHLHYTQLLSGEAKRVVFNNVAIAVHAGAKKPDGSYPTQTLTSANCPSGCSVTATPGLPPGGSVTCTEGAGVRVVVECLNTAKNIEYVSQGPWVGAGAASIAKCASTHAVTDRSFAISPP